MWASCGLDWAAYLKCSSEYLLRGAEENFQKTTWERHLQMGMGDTKLCVNISQSNHDSALSEVHTLMSKEGAVGSVPGEAVGKDAKFAFQQSRWRSTNREPHQARNSGASSTLPLNSSQMHTRKHPSLIYKDPYKYRYVLIGELQTQSQAGFAINLERIRRERGGTVINAVALGETCQRALWKLACLKNKKKKGGGAHHIVFKVCFPLNNSTLTEYFFHSPSSLFFPEDLSGAI